MMEQIVVHSFLLASLALLASLYCTLFYWLLCIGLSFSGLFCLASSLRFNSKPLLITLVRERSLETSLALKNYQPFCCTLFYWPLCIVLSVSYSLLLAYLYCTLFYWLLCIALSRISSTLG